MSSVTHWLIPEPCEASQVSRLSKTLNIPRAVAELLVQRGYGDPEAAGRFLKPRLSSLSDPFLLPDMEAAVHRLLTAIDRGEKIVLYGDYDVDGLTSLTVMSRVLKAYGATIECFLPQRKEEGYGLSPKGIARCIEEHAPDLLVAIDCGTSSRMEVAVLKEKGISVVILDHHECPTQLPDCVALVNPKRGRHFDYLCSVGIVFKVSHALLKQRPNPKVDLKDYLDLVALGSVADLVPLVDENRVLVQKGLLQLEVTKWKGVETLGRSAGVKPPWVAADIGFKVGPRLNAAGRLGEARRALDLLMCADEMDAEVFVQELETENNQRKIIGERVLQAAEEYVSRVFKPERDCILVVGGAGWHEGVIGIVASKLMHKYHRPCIVVGFDTDGNGKGSGRSVEGFSLVAALKACEGFLAKFGGHEMAAGLSVHQDRFEDFSQAMQAYARAQLDVAELVEKLRPNVEVRLHELTVSLIEEMDKLGPFGMANAAPLLLLRNVLPSGQVRVMKEKHISVELRQDKLSARAIWFNGAAHALPEPPWDVAFELTRNEYQGRVQPQIQIRAVRKSQ